MNQAPPPNEQVPWHGIHHIALATADIEATARFYAGTLGMQVSEIFPSRDGRGRHCLIFVKPGDNDVLGFHFFERPEIERSGAGIFGEDTRETLLHIAVRLPDENAALRLRERLHAAQVPITDIPELGSFVFPDNNGMFLEATWPKGNPEP